YEHDRIGFNYRMDAMQAAILRVKLKHLDEWNARRRQAALRYNEELAGVGDLILPSTDAGDGHVWHLYVIRTEDRDGMLEHLHKNGIDAGVHYPVPCHLQPALQAHFQSDPGLLMATEAA